MIVLDCSAAVEIVLGTSFGQGVSSLMLEGEKVITTSLFHAEIRNVFWKYVHAGIMSSRDAEARVGIALQLVDEIVPVSENSNEALREALIQDHSVYDMYYLTLARRYCATLVTRDKRLVALCEKMGIDCIYEVNV